MTLCRQLQLPSLVFQIIEAPDFCLFSGWGDLASSSTGAAPANKAVQITHSREHAETTWLRPGRFASTSLGQARRCTNEA